MRNARGPFTATRRAAVLLCAVASLVPWMQACPFKENGPVWSALRERYFIGFLKRNPVTSTYLGGTGYAPDLSEADGDLPDVTPAGRDEAIRFYRSVLDELDKVNPASLTPDEAIDREVVRAQIGFILHLNDAVRDYQRSVESYSVTPFRGVDWQIQQMTDLQDGHYGTEEEWDRVVRRVDAVPAYLEAARANLQEGIGAGNLPDHRVVEYDGVDAARSNATYFRTTLPGLAQRYLAPGQVRDRVVARLKKTGEGAARAFEAFGTFLGEAYRPYADRDRFMAGEQEYEWRLHHNLRLPPQQTAASLFEWGRNRVQESQDRLIAEAREVAGRRGLSLDWSDRSASLRSTRRVMDDLARDYPKSDEDMFRAYRAKAQELVEYARRHGMFKLPDTYRLQIVETPPVLESTLEAAYYPAPPFKSSGIGRFYLTASHGDVGVLKENNLHAIADLCAHEGFPGHDWHYQFMRSRAASISPIRWLTPGGVEDSSSMWEDSMAAEGWALYAEQLMAEPEPGAPDGFYTPEERIYQLKWQVLRDARVHIDTGLHTGRLSFDQAVAYFLANVELLPDACDTHGPADPLRVALCKSARRAVYRYSKWPTQAITYDLGKRDILELRDRFQEIQGDRFSLRSFHEAFMSQGTIPVGYFRDRLLQEARLP
ncbi:MAG TPA: DUF885 domain-containing protein [Candidatus Polarisedimenticolia bacterium]|nr:DUF885 domain-containing protein [Candidatus Polarisedimenticolia bacterium]